ncbi:MAG: hypothetical protein RRB13_15200 [bacterium]|nr:hypothetical protein [bacterium]
MSLPPKSSLGIGSVWIMAAFFGLLVAAQAQNPLVGHSALRSQLGPDWFDVEASLVWALGHFLGPQPVWIYLTQAALRLVSLGLLLALLGFHRGISRDQPGLRWLLSGLYLLAPLTLQGSFALSAHGHLSTPLLLAHYLALWFFDRKGGPLAMVLVFVSSLACLWVDLPVTLILWAALLGAQLVSGVPSRLVGAYGALAVALILVVGAQHSFGGPNQLLQSLALGQNPLTPWESIGALVFWLTPLLPLVLLLLFIKGLDPNGRASRAYWAPLLFVLGLCCTAPWLNTGEIPLRLMPLWPFLLLLLGLLLAGRGRHVEGWEFFLWWIALGVFFLLQRDPLRPFSVWLRSGNLEALAFALLPALGAAVVFWLGYYGALRGRGEVGAERLVRVLALVALAWLFAAPWRVWAPYNRVDDYGLKGHRRAVLQAQRNLPPDRKMLFPGAGARLGVEGVNGHCAAPESFDYLLLASPLLDWGGYCFGRQEALLGFEPVKKLGDYWLWRRRGVPEALQE